MKKILIWLIVMIGLVSLVNAGTPETGGLHYWNLSENNLTNINDTWGGLNLTNSGSFSAIDFPIFPVMNNGSPYSRRFDGSNDEITSDSNLDAGNTLNCWIKTPDNSGSERGILNFGTATTDDQGQLRSNADGTLHFQHRCSAWIQIDTTETIDDNIWKMITMVTNTTHFLAYVNATLIGALSDTCTIGGGGAVLDLGRNPATNPFHNGLIDECKHYSIALSQENITRLYQNGSIDIELPPPVISSSIDLLFANITEPFNFKTGFSERDDVFYYTNYTLSNSTELNETNAMCNFTGFDTLRTIPANNSNFSLCNTCDFNEFNQTNLELESIISSINDTIDFFGCHEQIASGDILLNVSCDGGNEVFTIIPSEMPLCSDTNGLAFVSRTTNVCSNSLLINFSITGNFPNSQRKRILELDVHRLFARHSLNFSVNTFYNESLELWRTNHSHIYEKHGSKVIETNCSFSGDSSLNDDTVENITIVNIPPLVFFDQIVFPNGSFFNLTEGSVYEFFNGTYQFIVSVVDDDLDVANVTLMNSTRDSLFSTLDFNNVNVTSALLIEFTNYNPFFLNITANDTVGNVTTREISFSFNDTISPDIIYISPLADNTSEFRSDFIDLTINLTDESLFSYDLNVTDCNGNILFNFSDMSLGGVTNFLVEQTVNFTNIDDGRYCSGIKVADGHTKFEIEDYVYKKNLTSKSLNFNYDLDLSFNKAVDEIYVIKNEDRYNFGIKTKGKVNELEIIVDSIDKMYILSESKYQGHLITGKYWIDFEDEDILFVKVYRIDNNSVRVYIRYNLLKDTFMFNSIGEFNVDNREVSFLVDRSPFIRFRFFVIDLSLEQIFSLCLLFMFALSIIIYAELKEHLIFMFLGGGYMLVYSILFILISPIFGVLLLIASLILILRVILVLLDVI